MVTNDFMWMHTRALKVPSFQFIIQSSSIPATFTAHTTIFILYYHFFRIFSVGRTRTALAFCAISDFFPNSCFITRRQRRMIHKQFFYCTKTTEKILITRTRNLAFEFALSRDFRPFQLQFATHQRLIRL